MRTLLPVMRFRHYLILTTYESVRFSRVNPVIPDSVFLLQVLGIVALAIGVLTDIGIATALCYYLQSMRLYYTQYVLVFQYTFYWFLIA